MTWHTDREKGLKSDTSKSRGMFTRPHFTEWEERESLIKPQETLSPTSWHRYEGRQTRSVHCNDLDQESAERS